MRPSLKYIIHLHDSYVPDAPSHLYIVKKQEWPSYPLPPNNEHTSNGQSINGLTPDLQ